MARRRTTAQSGRQRARLLIHSPSDPAKAFFLQAAFVDINIHKSRSVYYWLGSSSGTKGNTPTGKYNGQ
jgi:hypothetical protein